ncbi:MAG: hypothetical protein ACFFFG_15155 [Candidatus Thorarchaeota archaeon]
MPNPSPFTALRLTMITLILGLALPSLYELPIASFQYKDPNISRTLVPIDRKVNYNPLSDEITINSFPSSLVYDINLVFIGMNESHMNVSSLVDSLPRISQISRYVPLSYLFETFINYSINYHVFFMEPALAIDLSDAITKIGDYGFTLEMGLYWSGRTNITQYRRLQVPSTRDFLSNNLNTYRTTSGYSPAILSTSPTIFFTNFFVNNSIFWQNGNPVPHVFYLTRADQDTGLVSDLRLDSRYSPGFEWPDARWILLDLSSGPCPYEAVDLEYTNFFETSEETIDLNSRTSEMTTLVRSVVLARFLPTYVYEPIWKPTIELDLLVYHDSNFSTSNDIDFNVVKSSIQDLFPFSPVTLNYDSFEIVGGDEVDQYFDYIGGYSDYATWASQLIDFVASKEIQVFGNIDENNVLRLLTGVFATSRVSSNRSLGYTYGPLGSNRALGSVVTLSPLTSDTTKEGYTQTIIHELGHGLGLRHPHDFRYNGNLYKIWSWDIAETPLSYFHSVYQFSLLDKDASLRGNYRHVYNESIGMFERIRTVLQQKNFPINSYPSNVSAMLLNASDLIAGSVFEFQRHDYKLSLYEIIQGFQLILDAYDIVQKCSDYFYPIINFENVNNTSMDYGEEFQLKGESVTYESPNISITKNYLIRYAIVNETINHLSQHESSFVVSVPSILFGQPDTISYFHVQINDGVFIHKYVWSHYYEQLKISIISPANNMRINLGSSTQVGIYGNYRSSSSDSSISILYGSYWYVLDREDNMSFWESVNKSSGNQWFFDANTSRFSDGTNLIKVRIYNEEVLNNDSVSLQISGLNIINLNSSEPYHDTSHPTPPSSPSPNQIPEIPLVIQALVLIVPPLIVIQRVRQSRRKRQMTDIMDRDIVSLPDHKEALSDLKASINRRAPTREDSQEFKIKRKR